jgi:hypothetical protein
VIFYVVRPIKHPARRIRTEGIAMEMETRLVLKRSPQGEVVATLPMLLPVGATVADVLARAGFGGLDGRSVWVNGREIDAEGRVGAQISVTLFLEPDDPRPRSGASRAARVALANRQRRTARDSAIPSAGEEVEAENRAGGVFDPHVAPVPDPLARRCHEARHLTVT